jgi:hypothetical protein
MRTGMMVILTSSGPAEVASDGRLRPAPFEGDPVLGPPAPLDVSPTGEKALYLDANQGPMIGDGSGWSRIEVPTALLGGARQAQAWIKEQAP